jgi:hypothetical protein
MIKMTATLTEGGGLSLLKGSSKSTGRAID